MNPFLIFHILSGTATVILAIFLFWKPDLRNSKILSISSVVTITSGSYVAFISSMSFADFCSKLGLYLVAVLSAQIYFILKYYKKISINA